MEFKVDSVENLNVSDDEIFDLLSQVYVQAGFTSAEIAKTVFDPVKVRDRGMLFVSQELLENEFSGMVIVVPPKSKAIVRAKENECEMHLLGVSPKHRGHGLGRRLVRKAIDFATDSNWSKMILWTQKPMKEAQNLYESSGFVRTGEMTKNGIEFFVYERKLT
ncbi:MAG: GNAT family N-acetyltransferase [Thalassolituus oleivorans]|jgi:ribosomal protein S18 acetylase RimI-like enzyme|uniref:GNAT family N-acetyltransferase n=1 Tax=Thalassolituus oleivorans TaxID=187493 RepID=UPI001B7211A7|nr:GNAT family N-acetyltransferase [Thalassolituus oleivorans]MBQ0726299.1 GNAT family N-acetyltransferase [Thalassolituus oleivorans]